MQPLSVGVASIYEEAPMLDLEYTPRVRNPLGTKNVGLNTVYRIGSISKVFTVLALLQLKGKVNFAEPVTKYVPELKQLTKQQKTINDITTVKWDEITIDSLASQLGDIGQNFGEDLANMDLQFKELGFSPLNASEHSECGGSPGQRGCPRQDFFAKFGKRHPVYAPYTTPSYSNMAYAILGFVIENVTGLSYDENIQRCIFAPLNMTHTTVRKPPNDRIGFIAKETNWWGTDMGIENPSGGLYSSTSDLLKFGSAILKSQLLSPLDTRKWLKPRAHTSSLGVSVGSPWEIARGNNLTADKRVIDFYTKTGGLGDYNALLVLVPDYDLVVALNSAGPASNPTTVYGLMSQLLENLLPAIEAAGKAEALTKYAGEYRAITGSGGVTGAITLSVDEAGPGLKVTNWTSQGKDVLKEYPNLQIDSFGLAPGTTISARMYPTNLKTKGQEAWRAVFDVVNADGSPTDDSGLFFVQGSCTSWSAIDLTLYGLNGLDDFVFELDGKGGKAVSVTSRALRSTMVRMK